jgi:hypothetical protein
LGKGRKIEEKQGKLRKERLFRISLFLPTNFYKSVFPQFLFLFSIEEQLLLNEKARNLPCFFSFSFFGRDRETLAGSLILVIIHKSLVVVS